MSRMQYFEHSFAKKRVAIVADWLIDFGWAELVIQELLDMFPEAEIFTSVCFMQHPMLEWRVVHTSFLQKIPFLARRHKLTGILRPWAFRRFDLSDFDIVICSSSAESKNVACGKWRKKTPPPQKEKDDTVGDQNNIGTHKKAEKQQNGSSGEETVWVWWTERASFSSPETFGTFDYKSTESSQEKREQFPKVFVYCHTPIRYYWSHYREYLEMMEFWWLNPVARFLLPKVVGWMRKLDYETSQAVDVFWANSKTTAERIWKYYHRDSEVIYPGIKTEEFYRQESYKKQDFYLGIGRCIPYKKFDLMVEAFNKNGKKLKLATNTDNALYRELKEKSKPNIEWIFAPSKEERNRLYANAKAFLFPPEEDFWLVPVEAMASGTPVIAYWVGGGTETIVDGKTGIFFTPQTPEALNEAIERFEKMEFSTEEIRSRAEEFSTKNFRKKIFESLVKNG